MINSVIVGVRAALAGPSGKRILCEKFPTSGLRDMNLYIMCQHKSAVLLIRLDSSGDKRQLSSFQGRVT